MWKTF